MSFQWMKRKAKNFEAKKENCKVNDRLQKLICDLKSKRESLASVQTGFPSSVASFVTNTWMPSGEKKKKRWPYMKKKGSFQAECPVRSSGDLQSEICADPQSVGPFSEGPQSGVEICIDTQSGGLFSPHPESQGEILEQIYSGLGSTGQFDNDPQLLGQFGNVPGEFGNDPLSLERLGNDPQSRGQLGNVPESVGHVCNDLQVREQNSKDQIVEDVSCVGQLGVCSPVSEGPARLCPLCKELLVVVLVLAVSLSVVLDAKKAAVGVTAIVYLLIRVLFRKQQTESSNQCFSARNCIVSNLPFVWSEIRGALAGLLKWKNEVKHEALSCFNSTKDVCEGIQCSKMSKSDMNREPRKRRDHVGKSPLGKRTYEECRLKKSGARGLNFSSALRSSLLIVVLVGLMAGRFPAFVLALAWCLLVKLVQIAEGKKNISAPYMENK